MAKGNQKSVLNVMLPRPIKLMAKKFWISKRLFTNNAGQVATRRSTKKAKRLL
jgi:hypothetical protein